MGFESKQRPLLSGVSRVPRDLNTTPHLEIMSAATPLLDTIEADEEAPVAQPTAQTRGPAREPVVLTPGGGGGARALDRLASTPSDAEAGLAGIFRQVRLVKFTLRKYAG